MNTADFIQQFPLRSYEKGQAILSEGETSDAVLFIETGYVKVTSLGNSGSEHMLWIASEEDIIPSEHLFSLNNSLRYFYAALSSVTVRVVDKASLLRTARSSVELMTMLAAGLSDNYDDLLLRIDAIDQPTIHDRLATTLEYLALRFGGGKTVDLHQIGLPLTHQDIAEMIGSTRETTSLELERLRSSGALDYNRSRFVIHPEKLAP